jgi:hypothetical protein
MTAFEDGLRCPICGEFFNATVTLDCEGQNVHSFCSLCIRRSLGTRKECPICRVAATQADLRPNRALDNVVKAYTATRPQLIKMVDGPGVGAAGASGTILSGSGTGPAGANSRKRARPAEDGDGRQPAPRPRRKFPSFNYNMLTEKKLRQLLDECKLNTQGNKERLVWRHKEYILLYVAGCPDDVTRVC